MVPKVTIGLVVLLGCFSSTILIPAQNQKGAGLAESLLDMRQTGLRPLTDFDRLPGKSAGRGTSQQDKEGGRMVNFPLGFAPTWSNNVVYSRDGKVGFVGSLWNNHLFSFDSATGEMIGNVVVGSGPGGIGINEQIDKRIILIKNFANSVSIIDATDPAQMRVQATFKLPDGYFFIFIDAGPAVRSDGRIGFIGSDKEDTDKLLIFDVGTGDLLSNATISDSGPTTTSLVKTPDSRLLAAVVTRDDGYITMVDATSPRSPEIVWSRSYGFDSTSDFSVNNIAFNSTGTIGFVGHGGNTVFSFNVSDGSVISSVYLGSGSRPRVMAFNELTGTLAVTNYGSSSVSIIQTTRDGFLTLQATFTPPDNADLGILNNPALSADGAIGFVASRSTNKLYAFRTSDGALITSVQMQGQSFTIKTFRLPGRRLVSVVNTNFSPSVTLIDYTNPSQIGLAQEFRQRGGAGFGTTNNLVYSSDGSVCFIASGSTDLLYSVDAGTGDILDFLVTEDGPASMSSFEDGSNRLVALVNSFASLVSVVDVSDPTNMRVEKVIIPPPGTGFFFFNNVIISPEGQYLLIADFLGDRFLSFEVSSGTLIGGAIVGQFPARISFSTASRTVAVVNLASDSVSILDEFFGDLSFGGNFIPPSGSEFALTRNVAFSPEGDVCYVSSSANQTVFSFNINGELIAQFQFSDLPWIGRVALSADGKTLAVSLPDSVALFDTNELGDLSLRTTVAGSGGLDNVVFSPNNDFVYVASRNDGAVFTYDMDGNLLDSVNVGGTPSNIVQSATGQLAVLRSSHSIALIDPKFK